MQITDFFNFIEDTYTNILNCDFNKELASGLLKKQAFERYMQQDSLYLVDFAKALAITATKSQNLKHFSQLLHLADGVLMAERELHHYYFKEFNIKPTDVKNNACIAYTNFLLTTAYANSYEESLVALLPCFYIYREVGNSIKKQSLSTNPYSMWITTYSGTEFSDAVDIMLNITQQAVLNISPNSTKGIRLLELFKLSSELELFFWNDSYIG
jgi:thiaminase (transcriptional activator TenA)